MSIKQFKSKVNSDGTICLPEELGIGEGTEVNVILMETEEDNYSEADGILG